MNSVTPARIVDAPAAPVEVKHDEKVRVLDGMVKRLRTFVADLQEEVKEKDYEIRRLQARVRKIHTSQDAQVAKDAEVVKKDVIIQGLKKRLRKEERHSTESFQTSRAHQAVCRIIHGWRCCAGKSDGCPDKRRPSPAY